MNRFRRGHPNLPAPESISKAVTISTRRVRRSLLCGVVFASATLASSPAFADDPDNPVIGTWAWTTPGDGGCREVYVWGRDRTGYVTSGAEVTRTRFRIADEPDEAGFYRFDDEVLKDNRGRDCAHSSQDDTGRKTTFYIQISPKRDMIRICAKRSEKTCFGPLTRVVEVEI